MRARQKKKKNVKQKIGILRSNTERQEQKSKEKEEEKPLFDSHIEFSFRFRFKDCLFHYVALKHTLSLCFTSRFTYNYIHLFSRLSLQDSIFLFDSVYSTVFLSCSSITVIHCWSHMVSLSAFVPRYILFKYSLLNAKKV